MPEIEDNITPISNVSPPQEQSAPPFVSAAPEELKISTFEDLRSRAPEVYNELMKSLAQTILKDLQNGAERFKRASRQG